MFVKQLTWIILLLFTVTAVSCTQKGSQAFQLAKDQQSQKQYTAAIASYTQAISEQKGKNLVAASYFYRGECYERAGELSKAYRDFYTATQLSCKLMTTDKAAKTNTTALGVLAQSTLCRDYGPQAITRVEAQLEDAEAQRIRNKVDAELSAN